MERLINGASRLGIELTDGQIEQFATYYQEILDWNRRMNLTSVTDFEDVQIKHFLDSLTVSLVLNDITGSRGIAGGRELKAIDVGTGAGFPGIPLRIAFPRIKLTLLESTGKKALFLEHITRVLHLADVVVIAARSEDAGHLDNLREMYEVVLSRAVAALPSLLELTLPFCRVGGIVVAQKSSEAKTEIKEGAKGAELLGGRLKEIVDVSIPELRDHCLIVYEKVSGTPARYPRRAGMPSKRPLA